MNQRFCYYCTAPVGPADEACATCQQPQILNRRYRLERVLGSGGFGVVYAATDLRLGRICAIKAVHALSLAEQQRVEAEASILGRYASDLPFIPDVYDIWSQAGQTYLVMEFIAGTTLDQLRQLPWPPGQVAAFLETMLGYLAQLHAAGIIHRDLKPQNIVCTPQGRYVLLDFGIAKQGSQTLTAAKALSPDFAAPEQFSGQPTDARSDLYSLAATGYYLLTGRPPAHALARLDADSAPRAIAALGTAVPPALQVALLSMLALDAAQRPGNATAALRLLTAEPGPTSAGQATVRASEPLPTTPIESTPPPTPRRWRLLALPLVLLVLLGAGGLLLAQARETSQRQAQATAAAQQRATTQSFAILQAAATQRASAQIATAASMATASAATAQAASATSAALALPSSTLSPTASATATLTPTATLRPRMQPRATATTVVATPQPAPIPAASNTPVIEPTATPASQPTDRPRSTRAPRPTATIPTNTSVPPSDTPTTEPTQDPASPEPTTEPTQEVASPEPTTEPTQEVASPEPTIEPSAEPTPAARTAKAFAQTI